MELSMATHLVFVYGSLKNGFGNHYHLQTARFLEATRTGSRSFRMESMGGFPAVLKNGSYAIEGELYEVDDRTLARLDQLEGNGHFYNRELVFLASGDTAWMYILMHDRGNYSNNRRVKNTRNHTQRWLGNMEGWQIANKQYTSPQRSATL
jgi:gamma-glutamylcyclotransferase (GGCT)/AIG2-like uncharacterized protein YtfP